LSRPAIPSHADLLRVVQRGRLAPRDAPPVTHIVRPEPGQESVWDFPRPPRVEDVAARVRVVAFGRTVADTARAIRIVETAGAPCYYLPPEDCDETLLVATADWTVCEWKGVAVAYDLRSGARVIRNAAWSYPDPLTDLGAGYERIAGYVAYASRVDACFVGAEQVRPQAGGFYGGWITGGLTGPIKGAPGSGNW
jgi:uncharacterized protein (DUF427 family)